MSCGLGRAGEHLWAGDGNKHFPPGTARVPPGVSIYLVFRNITGSINSLDLHSISSLHYTCIFVTPNMINL